MQVLSLMLGQSGLHLHTFPEVAFRLDKWTMQGYPCVLDKTPNRQLDIHVRSVNSPVSTCNSDHCTEGLLRLGHSRKALRVGSCV